MTIKRAAAFAPLGLLCAAGWLLAQQPALRLAATTENVSGAPEAIRIDVLRWSTDAERDQLISAWTHPVAPPPPAGRGRGGAGRGRGGAAATPDGAAAPAGAAAAGRGGRGGRGGGRGAAADTTPVTPESSLEAALEKAPTVGYLWSSEVAGYSLRYAAKIAEPDGGSRVVLVTERRLGAWNSAWRPAAPDAANKYQFSIIELRINSKEQGEGKASLTGKIVIDDAAKSIGLEDYSALPVVLKDVKPRSS